MPERRVVAGTLLGLIVLAGADCAGAAAARIGGVGVTLDTRLDVWDVVRLDDDTPHEHPSSVLSSALTAERGERLRFFTAVRSGFDGKIGDPKGGNPVLPINRIFADRDLFLDFDEAYLETSFEAFELRLGKQKVSWGQLDEIQPTDHLNPEDQTEFFFRPELERKIGVPGMRLLGYRGPWTIDGVWNPVYTAYRFPNRDDRWFPPLLVVPDAFESDLGTVPVRTSYRDVDRPPHTLASSDVGLRLTRFWHGAEISAAVFHGFDKRATFGARSIATLTPTGAAVAPVDIHADVAVFPTLHRITAVGFDLAVPVWLLALRAEAAWIGGRFFPVLLQQGLAPGSGALDAVREAAARVAESGMAEQVAVPIDATEIESDSLLYGVGIDYFMDASVSERLVRSPVLARSFFLLQLIEEVIFDHDSRLIADQVEHVLGFTFRQAFRDERILTEVKVAYAPNHGDYYVWPELTYKLWPRCHLQLGARFLGGSRTQPIGQYRDYDGVRFGVRLFL